MSASLPNSLDREHFVLLSLRAWLSTVAPLTISELKVKVQTLGRPAKDLIAKSGGICEFLKECSELSVHDDRVVVCLSSPGAPIAELKSHEIATNLNRLSKDEINSLNRHLSRLRIAAKSGSLVSTLQKRDHLTELRRQCETKRSELAALESQIRSVKCSDPSDAAERLTTLRIRRDDLLRELSKRGAIFEEKRSLDKELSRLDSDIESKEDRLERLKLKAVHGRERLAMFEQDLFFESRQHETLTDEYLTQHSSDSEKLARVLEVLLREKCSHSKAVLTAHIRSLEKLDAGETPASRTCRQRLADIKRHETELLRKIQERCVSLQTIAQLELIAVGSIRSPLLERRLSEVDCTYDDTSPAETHTATSERNPPTIDSERAVVAGVVVANCAICLDDLHSEPNERLECSHNFHSSCLAAMYLSGTTHCPLCRRYEPSAIEFPTL